MKTYDHAGLAPAEIRSHPWSVSERDPANRYYDLRANPALIRTSLEDFVPWSDWPAVETFYQLLEWLNGPESSLESNDCAFEGPSENRSGSSAKALEVTGRVMVLWRALPRNLSRSNIDRLRLSLHQSLNESDPDFELGVVGITLCRVRFLTLPQSERETTGWQLMLSFWAWGDSDDEVMVNLDRTLRNLLDSLRAVGRVESGGR